MQCCLFHFDMDICADLLIAIKWIFVDLYYLDLNFNLKTRWIFWKSVNFNTNYLQHVKEQAKDSLKELTTQQQKLSGLSMKK